MVKRLTTLAISLCMALVGSIAVAKTKADAVHAAEVASANAATLSERVSNGGKPYSTNCAACHQATGKGLSVICTMVDGIQNTVIS